MFADLDGDSRPDLLVSAENGKVYAFRHDEISPGPEVPRKKCPIKSFSVD